MAVETVQQIRCVQTGIGRRHRALERWHCCPRAASFAPDQRHRCHVAAFLVVNMNAMVFESIRGFVERIGGCFQGFTALPEAARDRLIEPCMTKPPPPRPDQVTQHHAINNRKS
ncbi:hypothetical protein CAUPRSCDRAFT_11743 [Caulochytrium protostelioides]|uniref:Uncharacterized protein n=1 Tax=Caulochytrium protostelioides TaxID=1555241 RepID=A0A4V1ITC4_9FUNG|nr:hypothetical protein CAUPRSCDRAFT_11743 [Caulochytrium protostelioides]